MPYEGSPLGPRERMVSGVNTMVGAMDWRLLDEGWFKELRMPFYHLNVFSLVLLQLVG